MPITNPCAVCGVPFTSKKYGDHIPKYCSRECSNIGRNHRVEKSCLQCGKVYMAKQAALRGGAKGLCCCQRCAFDYAVAHRDKDYVSHFWTKVKILGPDDCWEYQEGKTVDGYGNYKAENGSVRAHRYAYEITNGPITEDKKVVMHTCDNPPCCNPKHLKLGTQQNNIEDMVEKKRHRCPEGENHSHAKITEEIVLILRKEYNGKRGNVGNMSSLARRFGITVQNVAAVVKRETWKHI